MTRKEFLQTTMAASLATLLNPLEGFAKGQKDPTKKLRVAVIGCGSVSTQYLPHISKSPYIELVACCDIIPRRAKRSAKEYGIPRWYDHIDKMLSDCEFDFMLTLTDMQEHEALNRKALMAGRNVWSEKPLANSYKAGKELYDLATEKGLRMWGAPAVVNSPQFVYMAEQIKNGTLGALASAHGHYGHEGPSWAAFFYEPTGGSLPDLGVYNIATLTGLIGPAKSVVAMTSIVTPKRTIYSEDNAQKEILVREEDNAMVLMEHENGVISHIECGFNYFDPYGHEGKGQQKSTISLYGSKGNMHLIGYDWAPNGVEISTLGHPVPQRFVEDSKGYQWQEGATDVTRHMVQGTEPRINVEHALHVLEIIEAARRSQKTGKRIVLKSKFPFPMV